MRGGMRGVGWELAGVPVASAAADSAAAGVCSSTTFKYMYICFL